MDVSICDRIIVLIVLFADLCTPRRQAKHSGSTAPDAREAAGRLRLEQACTEYLGDSGYPWKVFQGTIAIDTFRT